MSRLWYEVRVRENGTKKSRFWRATGPGEAASKYRGPGDVMWVQKVSKEKHGGSGGGFGSFFTLGDRILQELKDGGGLLEEAVESQEVVKVGNKQRRYHGNRRKETTNGY